MGATAMGATDTATITLIDLAASTTTISRPGRITTTYIGTATTMTPCLTEATITTIRTGLTTETRMGMATTEGVST